MSEATSGNCITYGTNPLTDLIMIGDRKTSHDLDYAGFNWCFLKDSQYHYNYLSKPICK